jgi:hypothetical protein
MIEHWLEWKEICSLNGCSESARATLCEFAVTRFGSNLHRYAGMTNRRDPWGMALPGRDAWHLLETHLTVRNSRAGKRYKDWLFARAAAADCDPLQAVESGAALLMRDVTREYLKREVARAGTVSLDASWECSPNLDELLPDEADPTDPIALREYERLADRHASRLFGEADRRQQVALLAKELGLAFSDPAVAERAGCANTALYQAYADFVKHVGEFMKRTYPDDEAESLVRLALMTINRAKILAVEQENAESRRKATLVQVGGSF